MTSSALFYPPSSSSSSSSPSSFAILVWFRLLASCLLCGTAAVTSLGRGLGLGPRLVELVEGLGLIKVTDRCNDDDEEEEGMKEIMVS
jgi:hypothetical protein